VPAGGLREESHAKYMRHAAMNNMAKLTFELSAPISRPLLKPHGGTGICGVLSGPAGYRGSRLLGWRSRTLRLPRRAGSVRKRRGVG